MYENTYSSHSLTSKRLDFCQVLVSSHLILVPTCEIVVLFPLPTVQNCAVSAHGWCWRAGFQAVMLCCFPNNKLYLTFSYTVFQIRCLKGHCLILYVCMYEYVYTYCFLHLSNLILKD